jgi:DNA-binding MarR family transcriptional regulator
MPMSIAENEIDILETIHRSTEPVRQRDLAHAIGLSLGMTNAILKRLVTKGCLSLWRVNSRNIKYVVSPKGVDEIARRSYRYLRRTIGNIVRYKEAIEGFVDDVIDRGCREVILVGESDVSFLLEHACGKLKLPFRSVAIAPRPEDLRQSENALMVFSEVEPPPRDQGRRTGAAYLRELLSNLPPERDGNEPAASDWVPSARNAVKERHSAMEKPHR